MSSVVARIGVLFGALAAANGKRDVWRECSSLRARDGGCATRGWEGEERRQRQLADCFPNRHRGSWSRSGLGPVRTPFGVSRRRSSPGCLAPHYRRDRRRVAACSPACSFGAGSSSACSARSTRSSGSRWRGAAIARSGAPAAPATCSPSPRRRRSRAQPTAAHMAGTRYHILEGC